MIPDTFAAPVDARKVTKKGAGSRVREAAFLLSKGRLAESEALCDRILEDSPGHPPALHVLGIVHHQRGNSAEGEKLILEARKARPQDRTYSNSLGIVWLAQGRFDEAADAHRRAIEIDPQYPDAHFNLGNVMRLGGQLEEAAKAYQGALDIDPDYAEAHLNLGVIHLYGGELEAARRAFSRAIELRPDLAKARVNLAGLYRSQGELQRAREECQAALEISPDFVPGYVKLGSVLDDEGELGAAVAAFRKAVELSPQEKEAHIRLGFSLLQQGELEEGWKEYEWRFTNDGSPARREGCDQPIWQGEDLQERRILLVDEQGHGDTLHFIRYAHLVQERGGEVLFQSPAPLRSLLATCAGIDQLFGPDDDLPDFDFQIPLLSLPRVFGTQLENIPAKTPYLFPKAEPRPDLDEAFAAAGGDLKVGIVWAGNPAHPCDDLRSSGLEPFLPLTRLQGVHVFSLQFGDRAADLERIETSSITDLGDLLGDFASTGTIVQELDLVVTVDTSMAHLAGALGQETWLILHSRPDWRWLSQREDSPWYPALRLFRQETAGDWSGVFQRVEAELASRSNCSPFVDPTEPTLAKARPASQRSSRLVP
ncbi:MAG: tetratricopeptide repeat protein [Deltaproteobacteria bacterium]|nr:tetratricopeptide repeat protein [Deltaproteobacteria bacterium]